MSTAGFPRISNSIPRKEAILETLFDLPISREVNFVIHRI